MDDVPLGDLPAVALFTRLGVLAQRLGIDPFQLEAARKQLTSSAGAHARVWLDADATGIALRAQVPPPPMLTRPGTTFLELETHAGGKVARGTLLAVGARALDDDLAALEGVDAAVVTQLGDQLRTLGASTDLFGMRLAPPRAPWLLGVELGADSVAAVSAVAAALGIEPYQQVMLGALHGALAARGCLVTLACTPKALARTLTLEYRDLPWEQVVTTTDQIRGAKSGRAFGTLAGAFAAQRAAFLEITYQQDAVPVVRAAIEHTA